MDGLRVPLIFHALDEVTRYNYAADYVVALGDWYHTEHAVLYSAYMNPSNPKGIEPIPDSVVVNDGAPTVLQFVPGNTYRLRFIGELKGGLPIL